MAEQLMLICDTCGDRAVETVTFKTSAGNRQRDYCAKHLQELLKGSRIPKRGRKPGPGASGKRPAARRPIRKVKTSRKR